MPAPRVDTLLNELELTAIHSSGPGGQNVNKVATAIQLRFDVNSSPSLEGDVKARLAELAGRRMTSEGELVLTARRQRTQEGNRRDALARLQALLDAAAEPPRPRLATRTPASVRRKRLQDKRNRAAVKQSRRRPPAGED
ncbi:MAG: alternative ribosome rescue aminoacyl-tRNA hydrolase ArfB [Pseudomonadota bacterium]